MDSAFFFLSILLGARLQVVNLADPTTSPSTVQTSFSSLSGHLEPLGSKNVQHSIEVIQSFPTPKYFFQTYVVPSKPVLIQNGAKISPAFSKWTDEYFASLPESSVKNVHVEQRKKEVRTIPDEKVSLLDFLNTYKEQDIYMVTTVPTFIQSDVLLPPPLLCRDITGGMLADAVMWFSSGGTKSVLHHDDGLENINCLFSGTKELLFIDYHKYKHVVPIDFPDGAYSSVDVDRVDFEKYPGLIDVEYYNVTMQAGDCLYIPHRWFHQVRSYGRNIAVNLWWQHEAGFVPKDCDNMAQNQTLNKFKFTSLDDAYVDRTEDLLNHLQYYLKRDKISFRRFVKRLKKDPQLFPEGEDIEWTKELKSTVKSIFRIIDVDKDKYFSSADLDELEKSDDETIYALTNKYYQLNDLIEKERPLDNGDDADDDDDDDDNDDVLGDGDYDIKPVRRSNDKKAQDEL